MVIKSSLRPERKLWIPVIVLVAIVSRKVFFDPSALGFILKEMPMLKTFGNY
jgi:hypothetical protein